jgi:hypothetical protein
LIQASYDELLQFLGEMGEDVVIGDFVEVGEEGLEGVEGERDVEGYSRVEEFLGLEVEFVGGEEFGELVGVQGEAEVAQAGFAGLGHNNILLIEWIIKMDYHDVGGGVRMLISDLYSHWDIIECLSSYS